MADFLTLEDVAKKTKRKPEEIMTYVESRTIDAKHYCYPSGFGMSGHDIAFYPSVLDVIEVKKTRAPAKPKEK